MQVLSSLSSIPFYAPSAGFAPTNSADVSAIASSYAESAASGKLDATASSQFLTAIPSDYATTAYVDSSISGFAYESAVSGWTAKQDALTFGYDTSDKINAINGSALAGEGGGLVTAIGTSENGITSINNSGLVDTAALHSADYSSLYVQEPLYISASGDSSYIGISGNVGGVDSATCSAIASSYAESAASSKLDTTAFNSGDFYTTANPSGFIDSAYVDSAVSGKADASALSGYYTTANESGFITGVDLTDYATTAYMDSAVSSKADSSALSSYVPYSSLEYNTASAISGINGSALAAGSTYSAGEGIDITDDVISVETPVDIVAGPGIVIDNPDGNTLRVSTNENYETVLWSGSPTNSVTLSENMNNFECIDVYERWDNANANATVHRIYMEGKTTAVINFSIGANTWYLVVQKLDLNGTTLSVNSVHSIHGSSYTSTDIIHESNTTLLKNTIIKVVGIHRLANN